jgi:hypothetical protein
MQANDMLERYVHEVGRHLPNKLRADVSLEIKSALEDILDERGVDSEKDAAAVEAVLLEYGNPEKVAASYQPERWLIGPKLFPLFTLVLKIVMAVIGGLILLGFTVSAVTSGFTWSALLGFVGSLWQSFVGILGMLVIVFFFLERNGVSGDQEETWDPNSLPKIKDSNLLKRRDLIISITFAVAALVIFNGFPDWVAIYGSHNGVWGVIARLTPEFMQHIPWLSAVWALEIALNAEVLRQGRWNIATRWAEALHGAFTIFVLYRIIEGGPILTFAILSSLVKGALSIAIIVTIIELLSQLYRIIRSAITSSNPVLAE